MNVLDKIIETKSIFLESRKIDVPVESLKDSALYSRTTFSLADSLSRKDNLGIIAEFKRKSPSKGLINSAHSDPATIAKQYEDADVAAMSILTDKPYFGGSIEDVFQARRAITIPILRKEFMIDPYQVHEAKAIGADAILLIGAVLEKSKGEELCNLAKSIGLDVLYEIHDKEEIEKIPSNVDVVGVNNRDLKAFKVDFNYSKEVYDLLPADVLKISESGISKPETIADLRMKGFDGFLIGETFMKTAEPGKTCQTFIQECQKLLSK